jgi:hypothetical protein
LCEKAILHIKVLSAPLKPGFRFCLPVFAWGLAYGHHEICDSHGFDSHGFGDIMLGTQQ